MFILTYDTENMNLLTNHDYHSYIGNINVVDQYGINVSNDVFLTECYITDTYKEVFVGFEDFKGEYISIRTMYIGCSYKLAEEIIVN